jgi:hypothetical protein
VHRPNRALSHNQPSVAAASADSRASRLELRGSEWLFCIFCLYTILLRAAHGYPLVSARSWPLLAPLLPIGLAVAEARTGHRGWAIARDWVSPFLVLLAYWSVDSSVRARTVGRLEQSLVAWDRTLLETWGLRDAIERGGVILHSLLETAYLLLYAVPPLLVAWCYANRARQHVERAMLPFLVGTLAVYALLPVFPSQPPRVAFPGEDLPRHTMLIGQLNLWILGHADIHASVFPSGHVGVGFSAAFASWVAGHRRGMACALFAFAALVWVTTIYSRYHYAADGLAALGVSATAIALYAGCLQLRRRRSA